MKDQYQYIAEIHYQKGEIFNEDGQYDEAIECFDKVLKIIKNGDVKEDSWLRGGIFRALANSYRRRDQPGDKQKALDYLDEGLEFLSE
jgi:tetratricopeptide (TPR) repeat protein